MARWVKSHNQMRIFKQTATPAVVDGLKVGDLWIDTNTTAVVKVCTAITPSVTFDTLIDSVSPSLTTPVLGAASATSLSFSSTSGIIGTTTTDSAATGSVGEYVSATQGTPQSLTSTTGLTLTSISLTAGDWDVWGSVIFTSAATTNVVQEAGGTSLVTNTIDDDHASFQLKNAAAGVVQDGFNFFAIPMRRVSIGSTTTVYLVAQATFSVSTLSAYGKIQARRTR